MVYKRVAGGHSKCDAGVLSCYSLCCENCKGACEVNSVCLSHPHCPLTRTIALYLHDSFVDQLATN